MSKAVGNAVARNRVKRRLRHGVRELGVPEATDIVVRALPASGREPQRLMADLNSAWQRAQLRGTSC